MTIDRGVARASDGAEIAWEARGKGDEAVLLVMGLAGRAADWGDPFVEAMAQKRRAIVFDNRGTGGSSKPLPPYTLRQMADDATRVLDALGVRRAHVVGLSMGGMIAQRLAIDHGERVDRLVLLSTHMGGRGVVPPTPETMDAFGAMPGPRTALADLVRARFVAITAPGFAQSHPDAIDAMVEIALAQPMPMHAFFGQLQAILDDDRTARLSSIRAPTLVVHGDADRLIPVENGRALASAVPNARFHLLPGCGHLASWEQVDALTEVVGRFLDDA